MKKQILVPLDVISIGTLEHPTVRATKVMVQIPWQQTNASLDVHVVLTRDSTPYADTPIGAIAKAEEEAVVRVVPQGEVHVPVAAVAADV